MDWVEALALGLYTIIHHFLLQLHLPRIGAAFYFLEEILWPWAIGHLEDYLEEREVFYDVLKAQDEGFEIVWEDEEDEEEEWEDEEDFEEDIDDEPPLI